MVDHHHWQLDGSAPELYERYLVPAITQKWADDLVGRAQPRAGEEVLDVACGTGVVARSASRCMLHGHVTGLDLNKGMLAVAQTRGSEGAPIDWIEGSALDLPFPAGKFDLVLCQLGAVLSRSGSGPPRNTPGAVAVGSRRAQCLQSDRTNPGCERIRVGT
jgi:SAM-dependent methyltransferase